MVNSNDTLQNQKHTCPLNLETPAPLEDLQLIIAQNNLLSYRQSIQNIQTGQIFGYELLVRGPENSELHRPDKLFKTAAAFDKQDELEKACLKAHLQNVSLSPEKTAFTVNLSPKMLFDNEVLALLSECAFAHRVKLELTEHLPVDNWKPILAKMDELRKYGFQFWLDDVGCGYFDLELIDTVKPEVVKLCISLMNRLSAGDLFIDELSAVIKKVHQYGGCVLAEGIEREQQLIVVKELGVDFAQGFYFDRPTPMSSIL
ncbi:EAL domain-containing protein [Vibrio sonorensis]|uniref:EAL domain-containing protein n=1 Tax=Vibrio sonorensis TaxID=1004316 RepID=UPI0008DB2A0B|nr:EAL domain-containing protein [Vibrio sonorensis]